jgi:hypothetical protein
LIGPFQVQAKQRIVLLVLLLFGLPALVTSAFLMSGMRREVRDGLQPGGVLRGKVHDETGKGLADVEVVASALQGAMRRAEVGATRSDAQGQFEMNLPAVQGRYELLFSGAEWQDVRLEHGWLDSAGQPSDPGALDVLMLPGCALDVVLVRADGRPAGAGSYDFGGAPAGGIFAAWSASQVTRSGTFEDGTFSITGLPPMHGQLSIRMASGERIDSTLDLVRGKNQHKVQL